jgi:K+-sensing histidine kinase KdpD
MLTTTSAGMIWLEVSDGVPEAEREAIFAPFYWARGASEARRHGLGLSLVRHRPAPRRRCVASS